MLAFFVAVLAIATHTVSADFDPFAEDAGAELSSYSYNKLKPTIWPTHCYLWEVMGRTDKPSIHLVHGPAKMNEADLAANLVEHKVNDVKILPSGYVGVQRGVGPSGVSGMAFKFSGWRRGGIHLNGPAGVFMGTNWAMEMWLETSSVHAGGAATIIAGEGFNDAFEVQIREGTIQLAVGPRPPHGAEESAQRPRQQWPAHDSGARVPIGGWHRLVLVMESGHLKVEMDDGLSRGNIQGKGLETSMTHFFGAGGPGYFWGSGTGSGFEGSISDIKLCTDVEVASYKQQHGARDTAIQEFADTLTHVRRHNQGWLAPLRHQRNAVVLGGALVDAPSVLAPFRHVFQFNDEIETGLADKTSFVIINDLTNLCGCPDGDCCPPQARESLWQRLAPANGPPSTVMGYEGSPMWDRHSDSWLLGGLRPHGLDLTMAHVPVMCGSFLYPWLEEHFVGARLPIFRPCTTAMRLIAALLVGGVPFTLAGYNVSSRDVLHYNGAQAAAAERAGGLNFQEQFLVKELADLGLLHLNEEGRRADWRPRLPVPTDEAPAEVLPAEQPHRRARPGFLNKLTSMVRRPGPGE
eukprot:jgi/Mesvir1/11795/Mv00157-RA.1